MSDNNSNVNLSRFNAENIPTYMKNRPQWVVWGKRTTQGQDILTKDGKLNKIPFDPHNDKPAQSNQPDTWGTFADASHAYQTGWYNGVGFMFAEGDGLVGIDNDHCIIEGELTPKAESILAHFPNTYAEKSPSNNGYHIYCFGLALHCGKGEHEKWIELYGKDITGRRSNRYFCVTGNRISETSEITDGQAGLAWLHNTFKVAPVTSPPIIPTKTASSDRADNPRLEKYVHNAFFEEISKVRNAPDGERNDTLFKSAAALKEFCNSAWAAEFISEQEIEFALVDATTLPYKEAQRTIVSAFKKATGTREEPKASVIDSLPIAEKEATHFHLTDMGNAERFHAIYDGKAKYCAVNDTWYIWDGIKWRPDSNKKILTLGMKVSRSILAEASDPSLSKKDSKIITAHAYASESNTRIKSMLALAEAMLPVNLDDFDTHPMLLNIKNGTVDLTTGKLLPHDPSRLLTKIADVSYDANAKCPQWLKFVNWVFQDDQETIVFAQKAVGYSLTGSVREQAFFVLHGNGDNGKSTFINTIMALMGDYATVAPYTLLAKQKNGRHPTELAGLKGSRFVSASEFEQGTRLDERLIKELTNEVIKARFMRQDFFQFTQEHTIWLDTNHRPDIVGTDHAIWKRVKLIPFNNKIAKADMDGNLKKKLLKELPGILNWAIEGCLAWQLEGLNEPASVINAIDEYRTDQDVIGRFIDDCCAVNPNARVSTTELFKTYQQWCADNNERAKPNRVFGKEIKGRGFKSGKSGSTRYFKGVELANANSSCPKTIFDVPSVSSMNSGFGTSGTSWDMNKHSTKDFLASRGLDRDSMSHDVPTNEEINNGAALEWDMLKLNLHNASSDVPPSSICSEKIALNAQMVKEWFVDAFGKSGSGFGKRETIQKSLGIGDEDIEALIDQGVVKTCDNPDYLVLAK